MISRAAFLLEVRRRQESERVATWNGFPDDDDVDDDGGKGHPFRATLREAILAQQMAPQ